MNNSKQRKSITTINPKKLWGVVMISYLFIAFYFITGYFNVGYSSFFNGMGIGILISAVVMLISDMIQNKIYNKTFWILSMLFLPIIAAIVYMIQRDKLIYLSNKHRYQNDLSTKK